MNIPVESLFTAHGKREILKRLDNFVIFAMSGRTTDYANPMYNATLNTKNRTTSFP